MLFEIIGATAVLIVGIVLMAYSSDKAVSHSLKIAAALKISPLLIGLILVSLGTDLPEIVNSITSSAMGHADINIGDSLGSALTQITLVLGILPFLAGKFDIRKKEVLVVGACEVLALILTVSMAEKGYLTRINGLFLMASWPVFVLLTRGVMANNNEQKDFGMGTLDEEHFNHLRHWIIAILGFVGVAIGAFVVVQSVITLSANLNVPEYLISFFVVAIGTSLPELVVDLTAIRKKQYELAMGDIIGSCLIDASFSVGIGSFIFPQAISGELASTTGLYTIFASILVISVLALGGKVDKRTGALFIFVYFLSYLLIGI